MITRSGNAARRSIHALIGVMAVWSATPAFAAASFGGFGIGPSPADLGDPVFVSGSVVAFGSPGFVDVATFTYTFGSSGFTHVATYGGIGNTPGSTTFNDSVTFPSAGIFLLSGVLSDTVSPDQTISGLGITIFNNVGSNPRNPVPPGPVVGSPAGGRHIIRTRSAVMGRRGSLGITFPSQNIASFGPSTTAGNPYYVDPQAATGYDISVEAGGPNIASITFPTQANSYILHLSDGSPNKIIQGGVTYQFPGPGVTHFEINGINNQAPYSATDPNFVYGLTFYSTASDIRQTDTYIDMAPISGDANSDDVVNLDDYLALDRGFLNHLTGVSNGDFNNDGTINASDYASIDATYLAQGGPLAASEIAAHTAEFGTAYTDALDALSPNAIPEPASFGLLLLATVPLLCRPHRRG